MKSFRALHSAMFSKGGVTGRATRVSLECTPIGAGFYAFAFEEGNAADF